MAGSLLKNYTTGNKEARSDILRVTEFMVKNLKERLPRLRIWKAFGAIMNPENWPVNATEESLSNLIGEPVKGIESITELGAGSYIFKEFLGIFKIHGLDDYEAVEISTVRCLLKANEIKRKESAISRIDLYARVLQDKDILENELPGVLLFEIYLTQKTSNGVCEGLGRLSNIIREGVRAKMGLLFLEANLRLHFVPPLEISRKWYEYIRRMWVRCGGQQARCPSGNKRIKRAETVDPVGNDEVRSFTSRSLARKRQLALRLSPLIEDQSIT